MMLESDAPRLPPVYRLRSYESLTSTMDEAHRLAVEEGAEDGTLVWAREQSAGRGRLGREWVSGRGNLYLSLILRPECSIGQAAQLGFAAALAVGDAIGSVAPPMDVTYKWPNDVLINDRKIAGILLESRSSGQELDYMVLGVGVNVATFPKETAYPASSLRFEGTPADVSEVEVLQAFCRHFLSWASKWLEEGFPPLRSAWIRHAANKAKAVTVKTPGGDLEGTFKDLDEEGHLLLELSDGTLRMVTAGDVFPSAASSAQEGGA